MYISSFPENSYWEAEWQFNPTNSKIEIGLNGDESGPKENYRQWYIGLESKFDEILEQSKPVLSETYQKWIKKKLSDDIFNNLKLSGFDVEDPDSESINWEISFETKGDEWIGIIIPFKGNKIQKVIVDT